MEFSVVITFQVVSRHCIRRAHAMRPYGWDDCDFDCSEPDWMALFRIFFLDNFPSRVITFQVVNLAFDRA
jgi:hypothetical protein